MMEGRLLSAAITGEVRGRLSDCATCVNHTGNNGGEIAAGHSDLESLEKV